MSPTPQTRTPLALAAMTILALLWPPLLAAQEPSKAVEADAAAATQGWGASRKHDGLKAIIPRPGTEEAYLERYTVRANLDGGGWIGADFTLSNLGLGDGHGAVDMGIELPGEPKYKKVHKVSRDKWSSASDKFALKIAQSELRAIDADTFLMTHEDGDLKLELRFKNTLPMWQPGRGQIDVRDGYFKYHVVAPRATVTGKVIKGDKTFEVRATANAFIDHTATNVAPFDFAKRFVRFSDYRDDVTVLWREVRLEDKFGGQTLTWVMVGYKDQIVFDDAQASLRFGQVQEDTTTGYTIPFALQLDGKKGKDSVKMVMHGKKMTKKNLLDSYGSAAKLIAGTVSKPFRYSLSCKYTLQMTIQGVTATVQGQGNYTLDYVNL